MKEARRKFISCFSPNLGYTSLVNFFFAMLNYIHTHTTQTQTHPHTHTSLTNSVRLKTKTRYENGGYNLLKLSFLNFY